MEALRIAGWTSSRIVPIDHDIKTLRNDGFYIFQSVKNILREYANLRIEFFNLQNKLIDDLTFDVERATNLEVPELLNENYSLRINKKLCLIGTIYREHLVLMVAEDGSIYAGFDDLLLFIGGNIEEAIENIVMNNEFKKIVSIEK